MILRDSIPIYIRRIVLFIFVASAYILQSTTGLLYPVFGFNYNLLLPLVVAIGIFEKETTGFVFGVIAGCLADISSPKADGLNTFYFALAGCLAGLLMHYFLRTTLFSSMLVNFVICLFFNLGYWIFNVLIPVGDNGMSVFFASYLPMTLISSFIFPLLFYPVKWCRIFTLEIEKKYFG